MLLRLLKAIFPYKQIGWSEIREDFLRFSLLKTRWFQVLLHRLDAPQWHPQCHDHPWGFVTLILRGGYWEEVAEGTFWRRPWTALYRQAEFSHNVATKGVCWSLVVTGAKKREWGFRDYAGLPL